MRLVQSEQGVLTQKCGVEWPQLIGRAITAEKQPAADHLDSADNNRGATMGPLSTPDYPPTAAKSANGVSQGVSNEEQFLFIRSAMSVV